MPGIQKHEEGTATAIAATTTATATTAATTTATATTAATTTTTATAAVAVAGVESQSSVSDNACTARDRYVRRLVSYSVARDRPRTGA